MSATAYCGGCCGTPASTCLGSLARAAVIKAHWECWSDCNLRCGFCFRTKGRPLDTEQASQLVRALAGGGVSSVVFAGGDPALRSDLLEIVTLSRALGLGVEIQTNGHAVDSNFFKCLLLSDRVSLSIDGPSADAHDQLRGRRRNFERVLSLLASLGQHDIPVSVRTVVTVRNVSLISEIGELLSGFASIEKWRLLEFTPVEGGWSSRRHYELPPVEFENAVEVARNSYRGSGLVDCLTTLDKVGAYMMISPEGYVYGTTERAYFVTGQHEFIGNLLDSHLVDLAENLPLNPDRHVSRYRTPI